MKRIGWVFFKGSCRIYHSLTSILKHEKGKGGGEKYVSHTCETHRNWFSSKKRAKWLIIFFCSALSPSKSNYSRSEAASPCQDWHNDSLALSREGKQFATCLPDTPHYSLCKRSTEREDEIRKTNLFFLQSFIKSFSGKMFPNLQCSLLKPELTSC